RDVKDLKERKIEVLKATRSQNVPTRISKLICACGNALESSNIEVFLHGPGKSRRERITDEVRAIAGFSVDVRIRGIVDRKGPATLQLKDPVDLPPVEQRFLDSRGTLEEG